MAATILEALQNAHYNLVESPKAPAQMMIGKSQFSNAVALLEKGYDLHDKVEPLLEQYGTVDKVPEKQ